MEQLKSKEYFWILLDVLVLGIIVNLVFFVMPTIKKYGDSFAPARTITVSAEGKTVASPDVAESSFSIVSRGENPEQLAAANNGKMSAVIENLTANGVDKKDIKTTNYDLAPNYGYDKVTGRNFIFGYTLTQAVFVKMRDFGKVPAIIAGLTSLGVNQIGGISFSIDDPEKVLAEARADALKKAQAKANQMASETGARIGNVLSVAENQNQPIQYLNERSGAMGVAASSAPAPAIEPGTQEIKVNISVVYSLE